MSFFTLSHYKYLKLFFITSAIILSRSLKADVQKLDSALSFTIAGDMRSFTENPKQDGKRFFDGACEAMSRVGPGSFLLSPGDFDPPASNRAVIDRYLGKNFPWYIVVGNHDVENAVVMPWVRSWLKDKIPNVVHRGIAGSHLSLYSWDYGNSHFIAIDTYPWAVPGKKGVVDLTDDTFKWIEDDLKSTHKAFIWVTGHQPIQSFPDMDTHRSRHGTDSVSVNPQTAQRFIVLLEQYHVKAYLCGHTHDVSVKKLPGGLWQCDTGHCRGGGDTGSPSSFLKVQACSEGARVEIYRSDPSGNTYTLRSTVDLN
jgi:3',5'-cyclic AMP phosphodiesterase CpdA